jgi:hypothetical protein
LWDARHGLDFPRPRISTWPASAVETPAVQIQMPSAFARAELYDSQSFPALSKNESLLLRWFRQILRATNG